DPEYGLPALRAKAPSAGVLLAYERSGYDADPENRMPDVLDRWTVRRLVEAGANGIKVLIYYDPFDDKDLNLRKEIMIQRISGEVAYTKAEALRHFKEAADAATKPFIYLSAGVTDDVFRESLEYAAESGAPFSGVLCGRATWLEGLPIYAKQGRAAFDAWLADKGVRNIQMLNEVLDHAAKPWWTVYGGRDAIAA